MAARHELARNEAKSAIRTPHRSLPPPNVGASPGRSHAPRRRSSGLAQRGKHGDALTFTGEAIGRRL
ncbi:MAG: hypothetical protein LBT14_01330 [Treponema sp.]|nr:hypothetical protein [Treponema sp.]